ncbi:hypothetical protein K438DRAFT_1752969 [Mycena galopus ATCC 62051]|nr:hypothetical protein K438DRAFT_1752969 [Mycena galopus ATCC 62051]
MSFSCRDGCFTDATQLLCSSDERVLQKIRRTKEIRILTITGLKFRLNIPVFSSTAMEDNYARKGNQPRVLVLGSAQHSRRVWQSSRIGSNAFNNLSRSLVAAETRALGKIHSVQKLPNVNLRFWMIQDPLGRITPARRKDFERMADYSNQGYRQRNSGKHELKL